MDNVSEKFSNFSRKILNLAVQEAAFLEDDFVKNEHVLLSISRKYDTVAYKILIDHGLNTGNIKKKIIDSKSRSEFKGRFIYTEEIKLLIANSVKVAKRLGSDEVDEDHVFISMLIQEDTLAYNILKSAKIQLESVIMEVFDEKRRLSFEKPNPEFSGGADFANSSNSFEYAEHEKDKGPFIERLPMLKKYAADLTYMADGGSLKPAYKIDEYLDRILQVLCRKEKNCPLLVGDNGVGKTSLVYALAHNTAQGLMPNILEKKRIISLDLPAVTAGVKFKGELEDKLGKLIDEIKSNKDFIIFIDNFQIVSIMGSQDSTADVGLLFKEKLAKADIKVIGAADTASYKKYIEKDYSLKRKMQVISIKEPDEKICLEILKTLRPAFEKFHNLIITDETLTEAIKLSKRYINGQNLPDKAVDIIDEACAKKRIGKSKMLSNYENLNQKITKLKDDLSGSNMSGDYEEVLDIKHHIDYLNDKVIDLNENYKKSIGNFDILSKNDIAATIAVITGIPVEKLNTDKSKKLLNMSKDLKKDVIGQDEAVEVITKALQRAMTGLKDPGKPIGSFIFLGPTGVGKTHLCKMLAKYLFDDENALIRVDMSEYMEKYDVSKMIGSPPGYIGYSQGGQLTEKVKEKPYSVILFDEIEKAHSDIFDVLLQVLDDGRLTDSSGQTADFKNTIIIMTSNIGAQNVKKSINFGFSNAADDENLEMENLRIKKHYMSELKKNFKPEFLNRVDETVVFNQLSKIDIEKIVNLMIDKLASKLSDRNIHIELDSSAVNFISKNGYSKEYGARPLQRSIQKLLENELASKILNKQITDMDTVLVSSDGRTLDFKIEDGQEKDY